MKTWTVLAGALAVLVSACGDENENQEAGSDPPPRPGRSSTTSSVATRDREARPGPVRSVPADAPEVAARPPGQPAGPALSEAELEARRAAERARLEQAEARRAEQRQERVARLMEQIGTRLAENDADGDGFLTEEEISGPMARRFSDHDTNGDGLLDAGEQQAMLEKVAERMRSMPAGRVGGGRRGGTSRRGGAGGFPRRRN
jgi:hypothetical protein